MHYTYINLIYNLPGLDFSVDTGVIVSFCFSNGEHLPFIIDVKSLWPSLDTVCFSSEIVLNVTE